VELGIGDRVTRQIPVWGRVSACLRRYHMVGKITAIACYTALEALRNRLFWITLLAVLSAVGLAEFLSQVAITETRQVQSALLGASLRFAAVLIASLFVITSMIREFNDKGFELVLSLPVPRFGYYLGKMLGFTGIALVLAALVSLPLLFYAQPFQVLLWGSSLTCELLIIIGLSLLFLFTFNQVTPAFIAVLAFYLLSRTMGAIQLIGQNDMLNAHSLSQTLVDFTLDIIAHILPSLERFTQTEWLVYGTGGWFDLMPIMNQTLVYLVFISGAALFDLYRKNL
jgi:ABC-type transport system involved in multi-copper enzyme maturation permease subunit